MSRIVKGLGAINNAPSGDFTKATTKVNLLDSFMGKKTKTKRMQRLLHQVKAYMKT
jgi:hypothetical protein